MNFKTKTSLTLSAAALLVLSACGSDSSSSKPNAPEDLPGSGRLNKCHRLDTDTCAS